MERVRDSKKEDLLKGLTKEQIEKVKSCNSQEELLALAKEEGIELNDEQLTAISGGVYVWVLQPLLAQNVGLQTSLLMT